MQTGGRRVLRVQGLGFGIQGAGFRVWSLGLRVWVLGFGIQGSGFRVWSLALRVWVLGCGIQGSGFRVEGLGFRVKGFRVKGFRVEGLGFRVCCNYRERQGRIFSPRALIAWGFRFFGGFGWLELGGPKGFGSRTKRASQMQPERFTEHPRAESYKDPRLNSGHE